MVDVSYPGVYIQEVPSGVHTITGVSTSIAAFFGRATKGPMNKAVRCLSYADFLREFGGAHPKSDLAASVRLFFANGGTDCYVVRVAKGAKAAKVSLKSLKNELVLVATAKTVGKWANTLRLEVDYNTPNPYESFNLKAILEEGGAEKDSETFKDLNMDPDSSRFAPSFVTQSSDLIKLELHDDLFDSTAADPTAEPLNDITESFEGFSQSRRPTTIGDLKAALKAAINPAGSDPKRSKFEISVNGSAYVEVDLAPWTNAQIDAATQVGIEDFFHDKIKDALDTVDPSLDVTCELLVMAGTLRLLTITSDADPWSSVRIRRASSNDIAAALMLGIGQGGIEPTRRSNFRPAPTGTLLTIGDIAPLAGGESITSVLDDLSNLDQNDITQIDIDGTTVTLNLVTTAAADKWYENAADPTSPNGDNDGVREKLRLIKKAINDEASLKYRAEVWGYHLAVTPTEGTLNAKPTTIATDDPAGEFDNGLVINTRQYSLGTGSSSTFVDEKADGDDGSAPGVNDYVGTPEEQTGFYALDGVDLFNLMILPGDEEVGDTVLEMVWGPASTYCENERAFLLMDSPKDWVDSDGRPEVVQDTDLVGDLRSLVVNENSAVFYPHLKYASNGLTKKIGPSGAIAGLMARTDSTRGVWKAPAGVDADLRNVLGLELELTDMENGVLNKLGVNCMRAFPSGIVNWGARTMDGSDDLGSEWKYIPIRRFALFLEESLFRGTKWVVFEPNDEPLWAKIRLNLNAFMMRLFRQGAFQGTSPDQAFYVKCDSETTPQADIDLGIVNIEVGFAPLKPAEFVVIKIQQIAGEL